MKKTIVIFHAYYLPHLGGVEQYTKNIAQLLKKDYNVYIVASNEEGYPDYEDLDGIHLIHLPIYNLFKARYPILKKNKKYKALLKQILDLDIDYVICNTRYFQTTLLGCEVAKQKNAELFLIDHSSSHIQVGNSILDFLGAKYEDHLTRKIKKYNPRFYGVAKRTNEWLKYFGINAEGVFYNAIDDGAYIEPNRDEKKIKVLFTGRIIAEKGIVNLLEAFNKVEKNYDNIELTVAGDGPILEELKSKYSSEKIHYLGKQPHDEIMKLCSESDIFVYPSMYPEGLPTSILEAGLMKCAVLATDRGGTKEVIPNDDYGFIVEENVYDLTEKLNMVISDKDLRKKMQNNIYDNVIHNFTWVHTVETIKQALNEH